MTCNAAVRGHRRTEAPIKLWMERKITSGEKQKKNVPSTKRYCYYFNTPEYVLLPDRSIQSIQWDYLAALAKPTLYFWKSKPTLFFRTEGVYN